MKTALREQHLKLFYELLLQLETQVGGKRLLRDCHGRMTWPNRGVYFFFEKGETRHFDSASLRVVRVGTHAVSIGSKSTLWGRLKQHQGIASGGGNHRGSIFRHHVGAALMIQNNLTCSSWLDRNSRGKQVLAAEANLEKQVSTFIGNMLVLWLDVNDTPSSQSHRAVIEKNSIILLAGEDGQSPLDLPSPSWLGLHSVEVKIKYSGLWNLNYVGTPRKLEQYEPKFLDLMAQYVHLMV